MVEKISVRSSPKPEHRCKACAPDDEVTNAWAPTISCLYIGRN